MDILNIPLCSVSNHGGSEEGLIVFTVILVVILILLFRGRLSRMGDVSVLIYLCLFLTSTFANLLVLISNQRMRK